MHWGLAAWLVAIWVGLWGTPSLANLVSGVLVVAVLFVVFPVRVAREPTFAVRPLRAVLFAAWFAWKLAEATAVVVWEVVTPTRRLHEAVVALPVRGTTDAVVTFIAAVIGLTPGTLVIEVGGDPPVLYVHVLYLGDLSRARAALIEMERRAIRAFGSDGAIAALDGLTAAGPDGVEGVRP